REAEESALPDGPDEAAARAAEENSEEDELPEYIEEPALGDATLEEEPEDIWAEEPQGAEAPEIPEGAETEPADLPADRTPDSAEAGSSSPDRNATAAAGAQPDGQGSEEEPLLGPPTARLLEYLKSLSDQLPPEKREEFHSSGLDDKIDGLIKELENEEAPEEELEPSLLARGAQKRSGGTEAAPRRKADPRRSPLGRRGGAERRHSTERRQSERRQADRRTTPERRAGAERRDGDRRVPPPVVDIAGPIPAESVSVKVSPSGMPTEIAGIPVSPRLARLIEIARREKGQSSD
ncbi:MAG TPA: hypothetical protein VMC79_04645, partial [Rectinemataceae bacterium]|nr:hypothetical protein [Rectinemataceae bacterium]